MGVWQEKGKREYDQDNWWILQTTSVFLGGCILCSRLEAGELNRVDIRDFRIINKADEDVDIHRPERTFVLKDRKPGLKYG